VRSVYREIGFCRYFLILSRSCARSNCLIDHIGISKPIPTDWQFLLNLLPQLAWTAQPHGSNLFIFSMTSLGSIDFANTKCLQYTGLKSEGDEWQQAIHPEDVIATKETIDSCFKDNGIRQFRQEYRIKV
jgi:hypothetical protein